MLHGRGKKRDSTTSVGFPSLVVLPTGVAYSPTVKNILKKRTEKLAQDNLSAWLETQTRQIELRDDIAQTGACSICGTVFMKWGHNAAPVTDGRCCDDCNNQVVARRIDDMRVNAARSQSRAAEWQPIRQAGCRARFSGGAQGPTRL